MSLTLMTSALLGHRFLSGKESFVVFFFFNGVGIFVRFSLHNKLLEHQKNAIKMKQLLTQ